MYPDDQRKDRCGVRLYQLYQAKKPAATLKPDYSFFISCKNISKMRSWSNTDIWYTSSPMGLHTVGSLVSGQIKASCDDTETAKITGTSIR